MRYDVAESFPESVCKVVRNFEEVEVKYAVRYLGKDRDKGHTTWLGCRVEIKILFEGLNVDIIPIIDYIITEGLFELFVLFLSGRLTAMKLKNLACLGYAFLESPFSLDGIE